MFWDVVLGCRFRLYIVRKVIYTIGGGEIRWGGLRVLVELGLSAGLARVKVGL